MFFIGFFTFFFNDRIGIAAKNSRRAAEVLLELAEACDGFLDKIKTPLAILLQAEATLFKPLTIMSLMT